MSLPPSRREFCAAAGAGLLALQLPGCGDGAPATDGGTNDLAQAASDLSPPPADMTPGCGPASSIGGGQAAGVAAGQAEFIAKGHFFVCRDAGGLYALTSICTHNGCDVGFLSQAAGFQCPCHGSQFDFNGAVTGPPAPLPLDHLALCTAPNGDVFVDPNTVVPANKRY